MVLRWFLVAVLTVAACGGDDDGGGGGNIDGGGSGGPDAALVDAGPTTMSVTVLDDQGEALPGAQVLWVDSDGELAEDDTTDDDGVASAEMFPGGSLHVVHETGGGFEEASSFIDLWPEASIISQIKNGMKAREDVTISWPAPEDADADTQYRAIVACFPDYDSGVRTATGALTVDVPVDSACVDDFDVLVIAIRPALPLQSLRASGVSGPTVELTGEWTDNELLDVALTDVPDTGGEVQVGVHSWFRQDMMNTVTLDFTGLQPDGTTELNISALTNHAVHVFFLGGTAGGFYFERLPPTTREYTRSLNGRLQPAPSVATPDLAARTVSWSETALDGTESARGQFLVAQLRFSGESAVIWSVVAPMSSTRPGGEEGTWVLDLPDVPGDRSFEPADGDNFMEGDINTVLVDEGADQARGIAEYALNYDLRFFDVPEVTYFSLSRSSIVE